MSLFSKHQRHQAPLREEVAYVLFAVLVANTPNKDPRRLDSAQYVLLGLRILLIFSPRCCESHRKRASDSGKVLHLYHSAVGICRELISHEGIRRLFRIAVFRREH